MSAYTDRMNALNRMTPEERDADILRQAFGPLFAQMFSASDDTARLDAAMAGFAASAERADEAIDAFERKAPAHKPATPEVME